MTLSSTEIVVAGVRSPVLQAGPPDATEAVVFVHGNPGPADDWTDLLERVGGFASAIAPDMPGYGSAEKPPDFDSTVPGYAAHLGGLLDQLGVERAHLRRARLRRPLGAGLGGRASRSVRERDADQHRRPDRLRVAPLRQDLAHADRRRAAPGDGDATCLLEGLGHWPFLEDPERVASLVVPFLREQLGAAGAGDAPGDRSRS